MQYKINISIDDVSPHPKSSVHVLERCREIIEIFEDVKFTLFIPFCYTRKNEISYPLDNYMDFCDILRGLPGDNFELGYHGYYHGILSASNNDEFRDLSYDQAMERLQMMFAMAKKSNLYETFKPIFRPPAWRLSPGSFDACRDLGIKVLALSPKDYAREVYQGKDDNNKSVVYYNCAPPFEPLKYLSKTEIVYHACEWDRNYLNKEKSLELIRFLKKEQEKIKFCFMEEML